MSRPPKVRFFPYGVEVESGLLWLDSRKRRSFGVVTHAHGDHVARHETVLCTPETGELMRRRKNIGPKYVERRYGEKTRVGDLTVTLLPAGHILGSAMAFLEGPGGSLLFTGDVRPEGGLTCPPAEFVHADVLITEATFGLPRYRFPPADETRAKLVEFARATLAADETPVFLAYALGKAQEVMTALVSAGIPVAAHGTAWALCDVYRRFGMAFPGCRKLTRKGSRRVAVVVPPHFARQPEVIHQAPLRVAAVTGWDEMARRPGIDTSFPLSDHADYDGLVRVAEAVKPGKVYVIHGYAMEFAEDLRQRGFDAEGISGHTGPDGSEPPGMFGSPAPATS